MSEREKYCLYCGKKLPRIASFCVECGEKQREAEEGNLYLDQDDDVVEEMPQRILSETPARDVFLKTNISPSLKQKDESRNLNSKAFAKALLLLVIAILVFSTTFLPMLHLGIADRGDIYISLDLSVWDYVVFLSDSRQSVSVEEGDVSPLLKEYWKIQKNLEEFEDEEPEIFEQSNPHEDYMSKELADTIRELIVLIMRMQYQDINTELSVSFYLAGGTSIAYLCFAIVFLAIAILNCFYVLIKGTSSKLDRWNVGFLCASPMMLLISFYSMFLLHGLSYGKASLSVVSTVILTLLLLCIVGVIIFEIKKKYKKVPKRVVGRIVCAALSIMVIFALFLPVVNICTENEIKQATLRMDIGSFNVFSQIEGEYSYCANINVMELKEMLEKKAEYLLQKSSRALKNIDGDLDEFGENMMGILAANSPLVNFRTFFSFVPAFTLIVAYLAGCVFLKCTLSLIKGDEKKTARRKIRWWCLLLLISTIIVLVLNIIAVVSFDFAASFSKIPRFDITIGVGAIVSLILAIVILCVPKSILPIEEKTII